jgi:dimethylargininase
MKKIALTRAVSRVINNCELTHLDRQMIDLDRARAQHRDYESALIKLGCEVIALAEMIDHADSVFVEDTAVVLPEVALITRPGADSRKPEVDSIADALRPFRKLIFIDAPGTVDGGDVLVVGKNIFVGLSSRSNQSAIDQMQAKLGGYGYQVRGVDMHDCLHLKTAVTQVGANTLLINPAWVDRADFAAYDLIEVDPSEPFGANVVLIGDTVLYQPSYPKTLARLQSRGFNVILVDASELGKAEGALTCCSLIFSETKRDVDQ